MRRKLLIIDDEIEMRESLIDDLERFDLEIFFAAKILDSLKILEKESIDVVILDRMIESKEDGLKISTRIKANSEKYGAPLIIVLSKKTNREDVSYAYKIGSFDAYLRKPYIKNELVGILKNYFDKIKKFNIHTYKGFTLYMGNEKLFYLDAEIPISHLEFLFLFLMFQNVNRIVSKGKITRLCWQSYADKDVAIKNLVYKLRKKHDILYENLIAKKGLGYLLKN